MKMVVSCDSGGFTLSQDLADLNIFQLTILLDSMRAATHLVRETLRGQKPRGKPKRAIYQYQGQLYPNKSACGKAIASRENLGIKWPHKLCDQRVQAGQVKVIGL